MWLCGYVAKWSPYPSTYRLPSLHPTEVSRSLSWWSRSQTQEVPSSNNSQLLFATKWHTMEANKFRSKPISTTFHAPYDVWYKSQDHIHLLNIMWQRPIY